MTEKPTISFKKLHDDAQLPIYTTEEAAGADVRSVENVIIDIGDRRLIRTGLGCNIPKGWEIQVRPRSGLAFKNGVTVLNSPGTIDSDYPGELGVLLINNGEDPVEVSVGDRIAQVVVAPVYQAKFEWNSGMVRETGRDSAGFGSTGVK